MKIKDMVLAVIICTLVTGTLILAILDKEYRSSFIDLAKVGVGGYIGLTIPRSKA